MSRQYKNFVKKLDKFNITVNTTEEDYLRSLKDGITHPELNLVCRNGHNWSMKTSSIYNKLAKFSKENLTEFCAECTKPVISGEECIAVERCHDLGFEFVEYKNRNVEYICVCGNRTITHVSNLTREGRKAQCPKCQNNKFRNDQIKVAEYFTEHGCELLDEYTNRHTPVKYRCVCGTISTIRYADFIRGKRCKETCKVAKFKEFCQENYGVDNVFQLEEVKEKSRQTCLKKYNVEYCMQDPTIQKKAMSTAFHTRKKVTYKDHIWYVQGYEPFCIKDLLKNFKPNEIIAGEDSDIPSSGYTFNGKRKVWHPDIYLPTIKKLIEIKSTWTYNKAAEQIKAKIEQCDYDCELRIYNSDESIFEIVYRDAETSDISYYYGDKLVLGEPIPS